MERPYSGGATAGVCKVGFEGPTKHVAVVSVVWNQPQVWLQMETSLRARRSARAVGSEAESATLAAANERGVDEANWANATAPSELGKSQVASSTGQRIQRAACPGSSYDQQMAQKDETQWPGTTALLEWATHPAWGVDGGQAKQPCMDSRLQRVVSNAGWKAGGTADSPGPAQPLFAEHPVAARSKLGARAPHLPADVRTLWLSPGHPRGQRRPVWIDWPGGPFAIERMVDGAGNLCGVHCSRPSRTERWARANASNNEGRNNSASFEQPACTTTTNQSMGAPLQYDSATRRAGAAATRGSLSSRSAASEEWNPEISPGVGRAAGQEQRPDQVERTEAIGGRSIGWLSGGPQAPERAEIGGLFWSSAHRRVVGRRCWWGAPSQVCSSKMRISQRP